MTHVTTHGSAQIDAASVRGVALAATRTRGEATREFADDLVERRCVFVPARREIQLADNFLGTEMLRFSEHLLVTTVRAVFLLAAHEFGAPRFVIAVGRIRAVPVVMKQPIEAQLFFAVRREVHPNCETKIVLVRPVNAFERAKHVDHAALRHPQVRVPREPTQRKRAAEHRFRGGVCRSHGRYDPTPATSTSSSPRRRSMSSWYFRITPAVSWSSSGVISRAPRPSSAWLQSSVSAIPGRL